MAINCTIYAIGDELLEGSITDTNSSYIASKLSKIGVNIKRVCLIKDNIDEIVSAFKKAEKDSELIITTGGLGPTFDDLTASASAKAFGYSFTLNQVALNHIINMLEKRGVTIKESHKRQAMLPEGCLLFDNKMGTALGFGVKTAKGYMFGLPGIPYEMKYIFDNSLIQFIKTQFLLDEKYSVELKFKGLPESDVDDVIRNIHIPKDVDCTINVGKGDIVVRLRSFHKEHIESVKNILIDRLKDNFYGINDETLEHILLEKLKRKKLTVSTAESCTGGLIAKKITDIPGSSEVFLGSVVAYNNIIKERILNVSKDILEKYGAVSYECADKMLDGIKDLFRGDVNIAVTGIAGPTGGTTEKPVGLVYVGACYLNDKRIVEYKFSGDRDTIRERTSKAALSLAIDILK